MKQLYAMLRLDVLFQARSQVYGISVGMAVLFGLLGRFFFDAEYAGNVLSVFSLLAVGGTTYFFGAALVLLEKSQGTLHALRTSPLLSRTYLASKTITLMVLALLEGVIVGAIAFGARGSGSAGADGIGFDPVPLVVGLLLLGAFQTLVGLGQVVRHDAVTSFLIPDAVIIGTILQLPVFTVFEIGPSWLWYWIPTQGPLLLVLGAFQPLETWQWVYAFGISILAVAVAARWTQRRFARHIALQEARNAES